MYFQKNAWKSAISFNDHIKTRWGEDAKALLICDNLDAHIADKTKAAFGKDNRVFLFCLPPQVTEAIQPIDAGYGRSIRCCIGRLLDEWLMTEEHLRDWEEGMTAGQRRVLISKLVSAANKEVLENDTMRVGCFRRTGCLLTLDGTDDDLIRPQGLSQENLPIKIGGLVDLTDEDLANPCEVLLPEIWEAGAEDDDLYQGDLEPDEEMTDPQELVVDEQDKDDDKISIIEVNPIPASTTESTEDDSDNNPIKFPDEEEAVLLAGI